MDVRDIDLSLRFKYGIHTIFLFVDPSKTFSRIAEDLLEALGASYPSGLTTSVGSPDKTELPNDPLQIRFALPKIPSDLSQGWTQLDVGETDAPVNKGIKDNSVIAFDFYPEDADEGFEPEFPVDIPKFEEDVEEQ
ncbi:hypothetical protein K445DRAFT_345890 [Daldinia sp. EC12]|nr:hypothetical protein F4774DRAFT_382911 [Daldinia eschscholtzii]OTB19361.1 hypothetical protein K445DRAFT_345890 [Daldinia sp. EC12]